MSLNQKRFIRKYKESNRKFPGFNVSLVHHPFLHRSLPPPPLPPSFILLSLSSPLLSFNFCSPFPVKITGLLITFFSSILCESLVFLLETMFHLDGLAGLKLVILLSQPLEIYMLFYTWLLFLRGGNESVNDYCVEYHSPSIHPSIYPSMHAFIRTCIHPYNTI